jgi:hypothetical protein
MMEGGLSQMFRGKLPEAAGSLQFVWPIKLQGRNFETNLDSEILPRDRLIIGQLLFIISLSI